MCFSSWKVAFQLHGFAVSPFIGVFSSFQSPVCLFFFFNQSSHYMSLSLNQQAVLWRSEKVNVGKALIAPGERSPLTLFSLLVTFLIKRLTNDIQEGCFSSTKPRE